MTAIYDMTITLYGWIQLAYSWNIQLVEDKDKDIGSRTQAVSVHYPAIHSRNLMVHFHKILNPF